MNYLIYSIVPEYQQGQIDILRLTDTKQQAIEFVNTLIYKLIVDEMGRLHYKKAFVDSIDDIKKMPNGFYVIREDDKITVYNKKVNHKKIGLLFATVFDEIVINKHIVYYIKSIPKEGNNLTESLIESFRITTNLNSNHSPSLAVEPTAIVAVGICEKPDKIEVIDAIDIISKSSIGEKLETSADQIISNENRPLDNNLLSTEKTNSNIESAILKPVHDYTCHAFISDTSMCYNPVFVSGQGYCDTCTQTSQERINNLKDDKIKHRRYVSLTISKCLTKMDYTFGRNNKLTMATTIYDFIAMNRWYAEKYRGFCHAVIERLKSFVDEVEPHELERFNPQKYLDYFCGENDLEFIKGINVDNLKAVIDNL